MLPLAAPPRLGGRSARRGHPDRRLRGDRVQGGTGGGLRAKGYPPDRLQQIHEHAEYGDTLFWFALGLGVVALLLVLSTSRFVAGRNLPRWLPIVLTVVVAVLAVFALVYVYLTGDSGAKMVWDGVV
ncbi:DUF2231 domain-containing protein [Micromonospora sp. BRA006-A]|nr:DUF2231 domain-containing protein [Micromonospora sp. BRA006-A]